MAITPSENIKYIDLYNQTLGDIISKVSNINDADPNSYPASVPSVWRYNYSNKVTHDITARQKHGSEKNNCFTLYSIVNSTAVPITTTQKIKDDFNAYMKSRGLDVGTDKLISTKMLLHFYNSVSAFVTARLVLVSSQLTNEKKICYKTGSVSYGYVEPFPTYPDEQITAEQVKKSLNVLATTINDTKREQIVKYDIAFSSSSSSCSSSSSSSSSSSVFIAYFNI